MIIYNPPSFQFGWYAQVIGQKCDLDVWASILTDPDSILFLKASIENCPNLDTYFVTDSNLLNIAKPDTIIANPDTIIANPDAIIANPDAIKAVKSLMGRLNVKMAADHATLPLLLQDLTFIESKDKHITFSEGFRSQYCISSDEDISYPITLSKYKEFPKESRVYVLLNQFIKSKNAQSNRENFLIELYKLLEFAEHSAGGLKNFKKELGDQEKIYSELRSQANTYRHATPNVQYNSRLTIEFDFIENIVRTALRLLKNN